VSTTIPDLPTPRSLSYDRPTAGTILDTANSAKYKSVACALHARRMEATRGVPFSNGGGVRRDHTLRTLGPGNTVAMNAVTESNSCAGP